MRTLSLQKHPNQLAFSVNAVGVPNGLYDIPIWSIVKGLVTGKKESALKITVLEMTYEDVLVNFRIFQDFWHIGQALVANVLVFNLLEWPDFNILFQFAHEVQVLCVKY